MLQNHKLGSQKIFPLLPQPGGTGDLCEYGGEKCQLEMVY